ncbi:hypothetical protein HZS_5804 [Henneguya salminicola]|nr:hypothetical protein HZS_5804 [Henneguya salminicola]
MKKGSPLNNDIRARIIEEYNQRNSNQKIAEVFDRNRKPTISNKYMQEFGVRVRKSTAENILTGFSYALKQIHIAPESRNP